MILLPLTAMGALTVNNGGGATNITSTSAWITATVASTGAANPVLFSYWGTNDGGTNASSWKNTNSFGVCTQAAYSFQATGLAGSKIYYYRAKGTNTTETNWATYSAQFITLTTPTSAPPSSVQAVTVDTNDVLKHPGTNFWVTNKTAILAGIGALTNFTETDTNALAQLVIHTNKAATAAHSGLGTMAGASTGDYYLASNPNGYTNNTVTNDLNAVVATKVGTNDAPYTNAVALAGSAAQRTETNGWDVAAWDQAAINASSATGSIADILLWPTGTWNTAVQPATLEAHTTNQLNPHATTAAQVGAVATNDAKYLAGMTNLVNQYGATGSASFAANTLTITHGTNTGGGSGFPLSADGDLAGYKLTNGSYVGDGAGLTNVPGTETNSIALHGESNIVIRADGTNYYFGNTYAYDDTAVKAATNALNTRMGNAESATNALNTRVGTLEASTNAINTVANAALPKSETNDLKVAALTVTGAGGIDMKGGPITNVDYVTTTGTTFKTVSYSTQNTNKLQVTIEAGFRPKGCIAFASAVNKNYACWSSTDSDGVSGGIGASLGWFVPTASIFYTAPFGGTEWSMQWKGWTGTGMIVSNYSAGTMTETNSITCRFTFFR
jgi:hypothetical protein